MKNYQTFINVYKALIEDFKNDDYKYSIVLDYKDDMFNFSISNDLDEFVFSKKITMSIDDASFLIDEIRNDFIFSHKITLPGIKNDFKIKLPNLNKYSYVRCHHIKNTKFDIVVVIRNRSDENRALMAQKEALTKLEDEFKVLKKTN